MQGCVSPTELSDILLGRVKIINFSSLSPPAGGKLCLHTTYCCTLAWERAGGGEGLQGDGLNRIYTISHIWSHGQPFWILPASLGSPGNVPFFNIWKLI